VNPDYSRYPQGFPGAVKTDAVLQEKLKGAVDLDSAVSVSTDAGFEVTQEDWLSAQARNQEIDA
jgi:predicted ribosomally synthesized peptide with nif11-like leader